MENEDADDARLSDEARQTWSAPDGLSVIIGESGYRDVDGDYAAWFGTLGAVVVLARPDFQVFGAAARADGADALVLKLSELLKSGVAR